MFFYEPTVNISQALTIGEFVYLALAAVIKLSCLLFYRRVFAPNNVTLKFVYAGIAFIILVYTTMPSTTIFECTPIRKSWDELTPGHCYPKKILPYFSGAINVVTDLYVLILPIPVLWSLNLSLNRKLRLVGVFSLGILYVLSSQIFRAQPPSF